MAPMRAALCGLVAVALLAAAAGVAAQQARLLPVDEGAQDPGWMRFRARLLEALAGHDQKFVLGMLDGRVRNISGKDGVPEFRKLWEPQSADSVLWSELAKVLFLGSVYVKRDKGEGEICAPYVYYKWPQDDAGETDGAIIAKEALLKAKPAADAPTLKTLSYDLVKVLDWEVADEDKTSKQKWVQIKSESGAGYLPEEQIRSPLEYRACFARRGVAWRMTGFEVGD